MLTLVGVDMVIGGVRGTGCGRRLLQLDNYILVGEKEESGTGGKNGSGNSGY